MLAKMQGGGDEFAQAHARRLSDVIAQVAQAALLLDEAQWELEQDLPSFKADVIAYFVNKHLNGNYDPMDDDDYLVRIEYLLTAL
jgi:hypothetical protein